MNRFEQYLSHQRIVPYKKITFFLHWVKRCYLYCNKPTSATLRTLYLGKKIPFWVASKSFINLDNYQVRSWNAYKKPLHPCAGTMKREERAQQLWSIIVLGARNRQMLTHEIVGQACGVPPPSIGDFLRPIQRYCSEEDLPPLTSSIVNKNTGLSGEGFIADENVPLAQIQTFSVDWLSLSAPSAKQFADSYNRALHRR
jgi:hypothetical protein